MEMAQSIGNESMCRTAAAISVLSRAELGLPLAAAPAELVSSEPKREGDFAMMSQVISEALLALGDLERAEQIARYAYEHAAGRLREMLSALALGNVLLRLGSPHLSEAEHVYDQAITLAETLGARLPLTIAHLGAGELAAARGDPATGARHLRQALTLCRELGLARYQPRAERLLADMAPVTTFEGSAAHGADG